jgi:S-methylmethionine-dependent homocysteine/selenocysteine methylase
MAMLDSDLAGFLSDRPRVLDGATGTELERRGVPTGLPMWSAPALLDHPEVVERIHDEYVEAGVDLLTTNTFRTQRRALAAGGLGDRALELTTVAVRLARRASAGATGRVLVLGSAPTLEDCYRPDLVPADDALAREHGEHAENLVAAGVDAILVETMNTAREAVAAARAARSAGAPAIVSFVCWDGARLLSGEPLASAIEMAAALDPVAVAVNCLPPSNVEACLTTLGAAGLPFGVYANLGEPDDESGGFTRSEDVAPEAFAASASHWIEAGARFVGGCCGTTPAHLRAVVKRVSAP